MQKKYIQMVWCWWLGFGISSYSYDRLARQQDIAIELSKVKKCCYLDLKVYIDQEHNSFETS